MSTTVTEEQQGAPPPAERSSVALWVALLAGLSVVVGGLSAIFWASIVRVPAWHVLDNSAAVMSERGVTELAASDVWFVITGSLVGVGLGLVTWKWFRPLGWPTALLAAGAGLLAGVVCWQVGQILGPGSEAERLAGAMPGATVPAALQLRSYSALAVWGIAAVAPVLLISSLGPDEDDQSTRRRGSRVETTTTETGTVDERGVLTAADEQPT